MTATAPKPPTTPATDDRPLLCGGCGYDLRESAGRCPECGRRFDPNRLVEDLIPWEQRKHAGRVRCYVRTAWQATFRPRRIAAKAAMPVSLRDARSFRRVTLALTFLAFAAAALAVRPIVARAYGRPGDWSNDWSKLFTSPWSLAALLLGVLLGLYAAAAWSVACFRWAARGLPAPRRDRARAIGCYSCAPLAWTPVIAGAFTACAWVLWHQAALSYPATFGDFMLNPGTSPMPAAAVLVALMLVVGLRSSLYLLQVKSGCGWGRRLAATIALPVGWAAALVLVPALVQLLVVLVVVMALGPR